MPGSGVCIGNFEKMVKEIKRELRNAVSKWGDETLKDSQDNYCPYLTGRLKASGKKDIETDKPTEFFVRLSYSTPYALYRHEIPGPKYKYLQTPFNLHQKKLIDIVEKAMSEAIK